MPDPVPNASHADRQRMIVGLRRSKSTCTRDADQGKAVVALAAHRLHGGGAHPRRACEQLVEATHALDVGVRAGGVEDSALAYHVVYDDHAAYAGQLQRPCEVFGNALLVGIDEYEVERWQTFSCELG